MTSWLVMSNGSTIAGGATPVGDQPIGEKVPPPENKTPKLDTDKEKKKKKSKS